MMMAAHFSAISHVFNFVDTLAEWLEAPWNASINIPYVIIGVKDKTVIVDLHLCLQILDGAHIMRIDPVIGSILYQVYC